MVEDGRKLGAEGEREGEEATTWGGVREEGSRVRRGDGEVLKYARVRRMRGRRVNWVS